jgi:hypothetical protein
MYSYSKDRASISGQDSSKLVFIQQYFSENFWENISVEGNSKLIFIQ